MDIKKLIKDTASKYGIELCGVAGIDRFAESPEGRHPTDILPGCKSVIVIGKKLLDGIVQTNFRCYEDGREDLKGLWGTYGYSTLPNFELTYICYALANLIERETGEPATPLSTGPMTNGSQISIRHSAVAAGLGEFGWLGIVLTPEFGPRARFGVILTTAEIEPDPLYSGAKLCNPEKCGICTKVCPTQALSKFGEDKNPKIVHIGEKTYKYCNVNVFRCLVAEYAMTKTLGGKEDYVDSYDVTPEEFVAAKNKMPISELGLQHTDSWHCGKCQVYCPVGSWGEKYKKRGLSKGAGGILDVK
jgi:epoxyqueuosine reductase QueG